MPLADAWSVGNEETVGWIYQGFNAEELQAAFASARDQGKKFQPEDIWWTPGKAVNGAMTAQWFTFKTKMNDRFKAQMNPMTAQCSDHSEPLKPSIFRRKRSGPPQQEGPATS